MGIGAIRHPSYFLSHKDVLTLNTSVSVTTGKRFNFVNSNEVEVTGDAPYMDETFV